MELSSTTVGLAACSALLAFLISSVNILLHIRHYNKPRFQLYIIRILLIVPVYCVGSFLSLMVPNKALYFDTIRDCYEAFVIYCFLALMLEFTGGEANCVRRIATNPGAIAHPWPLCCLPLIPVGGRFLRWCKQGTLQFVVIRPLMALISLMMLGLGYYEASQYKICLLIIYNLSYTLALYMLYLFYVATRNLLKGFHPVLKFFSIKLVVFMTYWQSLVISLLPGAKPEDTERWNDFVLCMEMLVFAILHMKAFSHKEFIGALHDKSILENVTQILTVRDIVQDTIHNFKPVYQDYVLQNVTEVSKVGLSPSHHPLPSNTATPVHRELSVSRQKTTYRTRTFLLGNVDAPTNPSAASSAASSAQKTDLRQYGVHPRSGSISISVSVDFNNSRTTTPDPDKKNHKINSIRNPDLQPTTHHTTTATTTTTTHHTTTGITSPSSTSSNNSTFSTTMRPISPTNNNNILPRFPFSNQLSPSKTKTFANNQTEHTLLPQQEANLDQPMSRNSESQQPQSSFSQNFQKTKKSLIGLLNSGSRQNLPYKKCVDEEEEEIQNSDRHEDDMENGGGEQIYVEGGEREESISVAQGDGI